MRASAQINAASGSLAGAGQGLELRSALDLDQP